MHYSCLIITKDFPTDEVLDKVLAPYWEYSDDFSYETSPDFSWDGYRVGGRYNGTLKYKVSDDQEILGRSRNNGTTFRSFLLDEFEDFASNRSWMYNERRYYRSMGIRDGFLYVDAAFIPDILNIDSVECFCCIDKDGNVHIRKNIEGDDFDATLKSIIADSQDCYACIVDLHR